MIGSVTDIYVYDTEITPLLVVKVQSRYHTCLLTYSSFVSMRNIRNESYLIYNGPYRCESVHICEYLVRKAFRNVLLRIKVTSYYVLTLSFRPYLIFEFIKKMHVHLADPADMIHTFTDYCVYDTYGYG